MEVRKRRPKRGVVESLHVNDVINVVAGSEQREVPFRHRTNMQGIDLIYDGTNHVRVRIRYQRYQYRLPVGDTCPSTILSRALARKMPLGTDGSESSTDDETSDEDASMVVVDQDNQGVATVGMEFSRLDILYRILSLALDEVTAVVHWPKNIAGQVDTFDLWRVERWIQLQQDQELSDGG